MRYIPVGEQRDWLPVDYENYYLQRLLDDVATIKDAISRGNFVEAHCYNEREVEEMKTHLTQEQQKRVRFFWMTWPREKAVPHAD